VKKAASLTSGRNLLDDKRKKPPILRLIGGLVPQGSPQGQTPRAPLLRSTSVLHGLRAALGSSLVAETARPVRTTGTPTSTTRAMSSPGPPHPAPAASHRAGLQSSDA